MDTDRAERTLEPSRRLDPFEHIARDEIARLQSVIAALVVPAQSPVNAIDERNEVVTDRPIVARVTAVDAPEAESGVSTALDLAPPIVVRDDLSAFDPFAGLDPQAIDDLRHDLAGTPHGEPELLFDTDPGIVPRVDRERLASRTRRIRVAVSVAIVVCVGGVAFAVTKLPTGPRPTLASTAPTAPVPSEPVGAQTAQAEAELNVRRAYALTRFLYNNVRSYATTNPRTLGEYATNLTFVDATVDAAGPTQISVHAPDAQTLVLAARGDDTCAYLRDDRRSDQIAAITVASGGSCQAINAPAAGWTPISIR